MEKVAVMGNQFPRIVAIGDITLVYSEDHDWVGMYVNGGLRDEGHSLTIGMVLDALGLKYRQVEKDEEWFIEQGGNLPQFAVDLGLDDDDPDHDE